MDDMAQFQLPEEERRRLLFSNLMMGLGAGLLDSRGKNIWGPMSAGLLGGMQMGQQAIGDARRGMVDSYKLKREVEQDREQKAMRDAAAGFNQALGGILDQVKTDPAKAFQIYTNAANEALKFNDLKRAEQLFKEAEKYRAKYSATPHTVMRDGKPVLVQTSEYDAPRELDGFQPKPEIELRDMGGSVQAFDKLGTAPGSAFAKSLTPEAQQQNKQWQADYGLRANADRRAADAATKSSEPAWTNDLERGIQVDPRTGQSRPITSNGAPIGAKGATKQAEQSKTALTIINEAEKLVEKSTGSYLGAAVDQGARVFGGSTEGADASAQLQALEGALMLNQPRMEGPQSDKDTALYKQMAAKIGDPTVPNGQKKAALAVVKKLHQKYATGVSAGGATGGWSIQEVK